MPSTLRRSARLTRRAVAVAALCASAGAAWAQNAPPSTASEVNASGARPYYIGASQGFFHSSNVYRIPGGVSDTYSSTSLLAGFDQPIGRQRVYASGSLSLNRYFDEKALDNTSYNLAAGWDFQTVGSISGGLDVGLDQQLAAPAASTAESPDARRNLARSQRVNGRLLWGGPSILTVEARGGYSRVDYADEAYAGSESSRREAGLTAYYRPGARLRLGLGVRGDWTDQPAALVDPVTGVAQSNEVRGRNIDLVADYSVSAITSLSGRLSYTRQTNSNALLAGDDFSGLTGALTANYQATGKINAYLTLARDVGSAAYGRTFYAIALPSGSSDPSGTPVTSPTLSQQTVLFENNRVTSSASLGLRYAATAKIGVNLGLRYERARVASTSTAQADADSTDRTTLASVGIGYAATRLVSLGCDAGYERRNVSGGVDFSYSVKTVGCNGTIRWP
jgi:hypothetical protein